MTDYTEAVYQYIRTLGDPRDEVMTSIRPWLEKTYKLTNSEAQSIRRKAMEELASDRRVVRLNVRSRYVKILA